MELWIRTQDRSDLLKVIGFKTNYPLSNAIQGITETNLALTLGVYETEKRALELLDEIQNILKPKNIY